MQKQVLIPVAMVAVAALILAVALFLNRDDAPADADSTTVGDTADPELLVRDDSPRLSDGNEAVFVEFLDFECEACIALYPVIEDLRDTYGDRVTFVIRHMPLHGNSVEAALAAEAAADQGEFEAMYSRLFADPEEWGHRPDSQREVFFSYAEELGLDMSQFTASYDSPETLARVEQSEQDGRAVGVSGTPTFFLDGKQLNPTTVDDLVSSFDAALEN